MASTLLDAVRKAETAPASAARAHAYLCASLQSGHSPPSNSHTRGFPQYFVRNRAQLSVRTVTCIVGFTLTTLYSLDDDRDGTSSGDVLFLFLRFAFAYCFSGDEHNVMSSGGDTTRMLTASCVAFDSVCIPYFVFL